MADHPHVSATLRNRRMTVIEASLGQDKTHVMKRASLIAFAMLSTLLAVGAQANDSYLGCFGENASQRVAACTEIIEAPHTDSTSRSMAYSMRALAYSLRHEFDQAIEDYDAAIRINPDFAVALNNRAWAYFKMGRPADGLPDVERSLALDPTSPHAYDTRAHIRQWLGGPEGALADYRRAMQFGDDRIIKLYQCGLQNHKLYDGPVDGRWTTELIKALTVCVQSTACDPLPPDEDCRAATS